MGRNHVLPPDVPSMWGSSWKHSILTLTSCGEDQRPILIEFWTVEVGILIGKGLLVSGNNLNKKPFALAWVKKGVSWRQITINIMEISKNKTKSMTRPPRRWNFSESQFFMELLASSSFCLLHLFFLFFSTEWLFLLHKLKKKSGGCFLKFLVDFKEK